MRPSCKYARNDFADGIPMSQWLCNREDCKAKAVKKVPHPSLPGKIALCQKHLDEYQAGHRPRSKKGPLGRAAVIRRIEE